VTLKWECQRLRLAGINIASNAQQLGYAAGTKPEILLFGSALPGVVKDRHAPAAVDRLNLSRVLWTSRTIANLAGSEAITQGYLAESLQ